MFFNVEFLLPDGKGRLPSRLFFTALYRLGIPVERYQVPPNWKLEPKDIKLYTDSMLYDLLVYVRSGGEKNMDYKYVRDIVTILKSWADKDYTISVL